jgi:hypothetical protein
MNHDDLMVTLRTTTLIAVLSDRARSLTSTAPEDSRASRTSWRICWSKQKSLIKFACGAGSVSEIGYSGFI